MQTRKHVHIDNLTVNCKNSIHLFKRCISNSTHFQCICRPGTEGLYCENNTTSK